MSDVESSPILVHSCPPQIESWVSIESPFKIISPKSFLNPNDNGSDSQVDSKNCTPNTTTYSISSDLVVFYDSEDLERRDKLNLALRYAEVENRNESITVKNKNIETTPGRSANCSKNTLVLISANLKDNFDPNFDCSDAFVKDKLNIIHTSKCFIENENLNSLETHNTTPLVKKTKKRPRSSSILLKDRPSNRKRNFWTKNELDALTQGMQKFGTSWASILRDHGPNGLIDTRLANRSSVQLKDKARSERESREKAGLELGIFRIATTHN